jgi:tripartite-type tricarboxylate transporter receptor subunit TctC
MNDHGCRMVRLIRNFSLALFLCSMTGTFGVAAADEYPDKPIQIVVPGGPGIPVDLAVRKMAEKWQKILGQPVVVINKPGAGGAIGAEFVKSAKPDGYTLFAAFDSIMVALPVVKKVNYDFDSFTYLNGFGIGTIYFVVRSDAPWKSMQDLIADAKNRPDKITYGSYGYGVITQFVAERLWSNASTKLLYVPFKSSPEAATALAGGHIDVAVLSGTAGLIGNDKVRIIGVASEQRRPWLPAVPTLEEQGYPVSLDFIGAILAPAGLPPSVTEKLLAAFSTANAGFGDEFRQSFGNIDLVYVDMTGADVLKIWKERIKWFREIAPTLDLGPR